MSNKESIELKEKLARLEQQLAAEREARKKAEQFSNSLQDRLRAEEIKSADAETKLFLAEQKLREAQEQEPLVWVIDCEKDSDFNKLLDCAALGTRLPHDIQSAYLSSVEACEGVNVKLYAAPITPADVVELKRRLQDAEVRNSELVVHGQDKSRLIAELTRKLGEQQALNRALPARIADVCFSPSTTEHLCVSRFWIDSAHEEKLQPLDMAKEELTKLLEEAKRRAVPEGWKMVPVLPTDKMVDIGSSAARGYNPCDSYSVGWRVYQSMLSAAPQPKGVDK